MSTLVRFRCPFSPEYAVGRGGAGFEIKLPRDKYREGETIQGEVHLLGGSVIQKLDAIQIKLVREWSSEFYKTIAVIRDPGVHIGELAYRGEYVEEHVIEGDSLLSGYKSGNSN